MTDPITHPEVDHLDPTDATQALRASLRPEILKALESLGVDFEAAVSDAQPQPDPILMSRPVGFVLDGIPYPLHIAIETMLPPVNDSLAGLGVTLLFGEEIEDPATLLALGHAYLHVSGKPVALLLATPIECPHYTEGDTDGQ